MAAMTKEELKGYIQEQTLPLIKDTCGPLVADAVREQVEKSLAPLRTSTAFPVSQMGTQPTTTIQRQPGNMIARSIRAFALAKIEGTGTNGMLDVLKRWGDVDMAEEIAGLRSKALAAGVPTAGGYIVPEQYSADIIPLRRAATVVRSAGPRTVPLPNGILNLPKITAGASGFYVGENTAPTVSQPTFGGVTLTAKKLMALVPISNDLIRMSNPAADATVRDDLVRALAVTEDLAFLRGDGVSPTSPKGLRYWAPAANITASAGTSLANMTTDLGQAFVTLMNNNVPMVNWRWLMAPRSYKALALIQNTNGFFVFQQEMTVSRTLLGYPFSVTSSIPINLTVGANSDTSELYLVNFDDCTIGDNMGLMIDASQEASYTVGTTVIPAYPADQTLIRAITEHDFVARDANAIAIINGVRWS